MKILIDIGHPAHVHFFKNFAWEMEKRGHELTITTRDKDVTLRLLNAYGFRYECIGKMHKNIHGRAYEMLQRDYKLLTMARRFKTDVCISIGYLMSLIAKKLTGAPFIQFTDTEHNRIDRLLTDHCADVICTPSCFKKDLGKKQVRYNGYHELAYLHPNYFKADPSVLDAIGLTEGEKFIIVRFVSWQASHDVGQHGFDLQSKRNLVQELSKHARVLITSESPLPEDLEKYQITTSPEKIQDLLYYATMYIGEGATMASESAVLGTPAIYINPLKLGYIDEDESKYKIVYNFHNAQTDHTLVIEKAIELIQQPDLKAQWAKKREILLADKIDVTQFMVDFIENYPESFEEYKKTNNIG